MSDDKKKDLTGLQDLGDFNHDEDSGLEDLLIDDPFEEKDDKLDEILIDDPFEEDTIKDIMIDDPFKDEDPVASEEQLEEVFGEEEQEAEPLFDEEEVTGIHEQSQILELPSLPQDNQNNEEIETISEDIVVEQLEIDTDISGHEPGNLEQELNRDLNEDMAAHLPTHVEMESIPSFSLKITNFYTKQDKDEVRRILREFKIIKEEEIHIWERAIDRGQVLIPRIGEFVAVMCAHKLRHIDASFELGLSEEIYASEVEPLQKGPINSETLKLNKDFSFEKRSSEVDFSDIITSTTGQLENKKIVEYLGVVSEEQSIDTSEYESNVIQLTISEDQSTEIEPFGFKEVYRSLTEKLKHNAYRKKANAVINIQFQHLPIAHRENYYKIIATGTLAWVQKID